MIDTWNIIQCSILVFKCSGKRTARVGFLLVLRCSYTVINVSACLEGCVSQPVSGRLVTCPLFAPWELGKVSNMGWYGCGKQQSD